MRVEYLRMLYGGVELPQIRTDNGPQFTSIMFRELCESLGLEHERIPFKTPNMLPPFNKPLLVQKFC